LRRFLEDRIADAREELSDIDREVQKLLERKEKLWIMISDGKEALKKFCGSEKSEWDDGKPVDQYPPSGLYCPECRSPQFNTPGGSCCANGHGGLEGVREP
jgi:hypothetical protein